MAAVLTAATYLALEQAMLSKIRSDIKAALGDDYAIIALHMEDKSAILKLKNLVIVRPVHLETLR